MIVAHEAKVKTPYYDFWKFMRSVKDSVGKGKEQNINTSRWSELHNEFFFWLKQQDKEYLLETTS